MAIYSGSCHCGAIAYQFECSPVTEAMECNCSICNRKGAVMHFLPESAFTLKTPRENLSTYQFNKHHINHHFCDSCGTAPFSDGAGPDGKMMVAVNLRCVDGVDVRALKINFHNGAAD
jgi:hypothetical protein